MRSLRGPFRLLPLGCTCLLLACGSSGSSTAAEDASADAAPDAVPDAADASADAAIPDAIDASLEDGTPDGTPGDAAVEADVAPVNGPPSIDVIADTGTVAGFPIPPFGVGLYDDGGDATKLVVTARSSDQAFLPDANIQIGVINGAPGGRGGFTLTLTPATSAVGHADVTIEAADPEGLKSQRTFRVSLTAAAANGVELLSRTAATPPASSNGISMEPAVSGDGRVVVFTSTAGDLAAGGPSVGDLFVRDRVAGTTTRLGIAGRSGGAVITPDARYVAFVSLATALVPGDVNAVADVFVFDRTSSTFERVSVATDGSGANAQSSVDPLYPQGPFRRPAISDDGRYVAFESEASNLVAGDGNGVADVFVRDRVAHTTTRVSVSSAGVEANGASTQVAISGDGAVLAFDSVAKNLIAGETEADARSDVFLRVGAVTTRASAAHAGGPGNGASTAPSLSSQGRYLAFSSAATDLLPAIELYGKTDIYVLDRTTATMTRVNLDLNPAASQGHCYAPVISADGARVAFISDGVFPDLVNGLINGYVYDRSANAFTFVAKSLVGGAPSAGTGYGLSIAASGKYVVFQSPASNLFPGDANGAIDVFGLALP